MFNILLRLKTRRRMRRLIAGLGAGSGAFAVIGAFSGSHATVAIGCGAASGVLSMSAALLMQDRLCDADIESGAGRQAEIDSRRGSQSEDGNAEHAPISQEREHPSPFPPHSESMYSYPKSPYNVQTNYSIGRRETGWDVPYSMFSGYVATSCWLI
ncbi:hypothetical protein PM082_022478 [Marasmius tenuissimus]|nr:hypothetical protein PM082_022478 [Marasmius tenuissimus]